MRKLVLLCTALCAMLLASPVRAQVTAMWVASYGDNSNLTCSQSAPCATFAGALSNGGPALSQINCLNSGNYGSFILYGSMTIDCGTGNIGYVSRGSSAAIAISTSSTAVIILRHLNINGRGTADNGIVTAPFHSGTLIVEDCMIHGFRNGYGIYFAPISGRGLLQVSNSQIVDNVHGIGVLPYGGQIASVMLNQVELVGNATTGLVMTTNNSPGVVAGTMRNSLVGGNGNWGIYSDATQVYFTVEESSIIANLYHGIVTYPGTVLNVGASTIGGNGEGVRAYGGSLISFGNNQFSANGTDGNFTSTKALK